MNPSSASCESIRSAMIVDDHLVRDQVALVHVGLGVLADLGLLADGRAQDVAGRVVGQVEVLLEPFALGALA